MDLNQITIEAADFQKSVEFYCKIGLKLIVSERDEYARFELPSGSTTLSLHLAEKPIVGNTVLYFEVDDVARRHEQLVALGIEFESPPKNQNWRWTEARFSDPSGNKLCLFHGGLDRRFPPWRIEEQS